MNYGWAAPMNLQLISPATNCLQLSALPDLYGTLLRTGEPLDSPTRLGTDLDGIDRYDLLDSLNVRYVLTPFKVEQPPPGLQEVAQFRDEPVFVFYRGLLTGDISVNLNNNALPRAYWAASVTGVASEAEMIAAVMANNLHTTAVVLGSGGDIHKAPEDSVQIVEQRDGYLVVELFNVNKRFLVLSEVWHPGWQGRLDGEQTPLVRTNVSLMGL